MTSKRPVVGIALLLSALALVGCADRGQRAQAGVNGKVQPPWVGAAHPFVVPGWKSGDQASWQQQMTQRAQNQNEYLRTN